MENIVFVLPGLGKGGAERVVSELANEMTNRSYRVIVLLLDNNVIEYSLNPKIKVEFLAYDPTLSSIRRTRKRIRLLRNAIKRHQADTVISFLTSANILSCFACRKLKVRLIVSERSDPSCNCSKKADMLRKSAYKYADGFVFQTDKAKAWFSKSIQNKSKIIKNPLNPKLPQVRQTWHKEIVTASRLEKSKNIEMLIDAFAMLAESDTAYQLKIFGSGTLEAELKQYAQAKHCRNQITFMGMDNDWHHKVLDASLFVLSSDYEGMSNSLMEALAIGLPCIATDDRNGGARSVIEQDRNGILIPKRDTDALYHAMCQVLKDDAVKNRFSLEASKLKQSCDVSHICDEWLLFMRGE
mgnify:CR=1 FL=1